MNKYVRGCFFTLFSGFAFLVMGSSDRPNEGSAVDGTCVSSPPRQPKGEYLLSSPIASCFSSFAALEFAEATALSTSVSTSSLLSTGSTSSGGSSQSAGSFTSTSSVNSSPAQKITHVLSGSGKKNKRRKLKHEEATFLADNLVRLESTPGDTRTTLARSVVSYCNTSLEQSPTVDPRSPVRNPSISNNHELLNLYRNAQGNESKMLRVGLVHTAAAVGGTPVREEYSVYDIDHSQRADIKCDRLGVVKKVLGGHDLNSYARGQLAPECFIATDGRAIGVSVGGQVLKTVQRSFDAGNIKAIVKDSKTVATQDELEVRRTSDGRFYGEFRHAGMRLVVNTIFPIIVVNQLNSASSSSSGDVKIGSFGVLSDDHATITNARNFLVSQNYFNGMVRDGNPLTMHAKYSGDTMLTDITTPILTHLKAHKDASMKEFYPIFALTKK